MNRLGDNRGLTLLEVMIALSVAAISLTALLSLGIRTIQTGDRVERTTQAVLLAQRLMSDFESGAAPLPGDGEAGTFEPPAENYRWDVTYAPTPIGSLQQISLRVLWEGAAPQEAVTLDSYVQR